MLKARDFRQRDEHSCTACVLRYGLYLLTDETITKKDAEKLTKCKPNGATFVQLQRAFKKFGLKTVDRKLTAKNMIDAVKKGRLVVTDDINTWEKDPHAIMVYKYKKKKLYVFDSYTKRGIRIKRPDKVLENATEMFEVYIKD